MGRWLGFGDWIGLNGTKEGWGLGIRWREEKRGGMICEGGGAVGVCHGAAGLDRNGGGRPWEMI